MSILWTGDELPASGRAAGVLGGVGRRLYLALAVLVGTLGLGIIGVQVQAFGEGPRLDPVAPSAPVRPGSGRRFELVRVSSEDQLRPRGAGRFDTSCSGIGDLFGNGARQGFGRRSGRGWIGVEPGVSLWDRGGSLVRRGPGVPRAPAGSPAVLLGRV